MESTKSQPRTQVSGELEGFPKPGSPLALRRSPVYIACAAIFHSLTHSKLTQTHSLSLTHSLTHSPSLEVDCCSCIQVTP